MKRNSHAELKKILIGGIFIVLAANSSPAGESDWANFYPLCLGDRREYQINYKGKEIIANVDIVKSYEEDGREYFVLRSDENDVEYHITGNQEGIFLRRWRYPFRALCMESPP